ncbi:MAG: triose-phosphate isomerase [Sediminibacterium sp.]|nr:triose-phosphate isomerase [Sediminibacterium sp.]
MRKQIAAANWKMNLTLSQAAALTQQLMDAPIHLQPHQEVVLAVPAPYLYSIVQLLQGKPGFRVAAQNCYTKVSGAFTGEISVEMLTSIGVSHVVLGHSERREYFNESNEMLAQKVSIALEHQLTPIFCCGEPLQVREANTQNEWVALQLKESLYHLSAEQITQLVIAYEPIWAIGTGKTASSLQAQEIHAFIRAQLGAQYGDSVAQQIPVLYGGSVKAANAVELFQQPDVDGGLVGGASLQAAEFTAIVQALQ